MRQLQDAQLRGKLAAAGSIVDAAWQELRRTSYPTLTSDSEADLVPDISWEEAQRRSGVGRELVQRVDALDQREIPHDLVLSLRLARFFAVTWSQEADWYWLVIDLFRTGAFGLFLPAAYTGARLLHHVHQRLKAYSFNASGDCDEYLDAIGAYSRLIDQFSSRTAGQAERGIRIPKVQVPHARALLAGFKTCVRDSLGVSPDRLTAVRSGIFLKELGRRISTSVVPAFEHAIDGLSEDYAAHAPDGVGIGQYPGGADVYAALVKIHTTFDVTPEHVHARGIERMAEIASSVRTMQIGEGFSGNASGFSDYLANQWRWQERSAEPVADIYQRYIDRLHPHLTELFAKLPSAPYGVAPLTQSLQTSTTFGYYAPPTRHRESGLYMYNPANATAKSLMSAATLTYHELMPGHHLHVSLQRENTALHPFRAFSLVTAYAEGWAEYAATLAGEIGMYQWPAERFGRHMMDAMLTSRLVVDTGLNVMGWSLDQAQAYMTGQTAMSEAEVRSELLRYSCDRPAQALAYKLGDTKILALRERMRQELGSQFDLKQFHAAILNVGALPMSELEMHLEHEIERLKSNALN